MSGWSAKPSNSFELLLIYVSHFIIYLLHLTPTSELVTLTQFIITQNSQADTASVHTFLRCSGFVLVLPA
jgi:hypothetical protein